MFKKWFQNLKQVHVPATGKDALVRDPSYYMTSRDGRAEMVEKRKPDDIANLKAALVRAKQERLTASLIDFENQLERVLRAQSAFTHQSMLELDQRSDVTAIVRETLHQEMAKLRFMVYEDINVTPEVAEAVYQQYLEGQQ